MILGIGVDIVPIARIDQLLSRQKDSFLKKVFTQNEQRLGNQLPTSQQAAFYAKRFAVKEAVSKALGTGIGKSAHWLDIETLRLPSGAPTTCLSGLADHRALILSHGKPYRIHVSLADDVFAEAFVILES